MSYHGMKPMHQHDCKRCVFVACIVQDDVDLDAYVCPKDGPGTGSVVLRRSSDGPDYWSIPLDMVNQVAEPASIWGSERTAFNANGILAQWTVREWIAQGPV